MHSIKANCERCGASINVNRMAQHESMHHREDFRLLGRVSTGETLLYTDEEGRTFSVFVVSHSNEALRVCGVKDGPAFVVRPSQVSRRVAMGVS